MHSSPWRLFNDWSLHRSHCNPAYLGCASLMFLKCWRGVREDEDMRHADSPPVSCVLFNRKGQITLQQLFITLHYLAFIIQAYVISWHFLQLMDIFNKVAGDRWKFICCIMALYFYNLFYDSYRGLHGCSMVVKTRETFCMALLLAVQLQHQNLCLPMFFDAFMKIIIFI